MAYRLATTTLLVTLGLVAKPLIAFGEEAVGHTAAFNNVLDLLGSWIWDAKTFDVQTCQLWRPFEIPATNKVINPRLLMTADVTNVEHR